MWEQILSGLIWAIIWWFFSIYASKNIIKSTLEQEKMKISLDYEKIYNTREVKILSRSI